MFFLLLLAGCPAYGIVASQAPADTFDALQPVPPLPTAAQLAWHQMQTYAFIHFGPNTFTGNEWGAGTEPESIFNPVSLDCRQWVRVFKAAGLRGAIITAKHHDGFCLWPSRYSTHTVAESPWRGGRGDVLRELSKACREAGLKFGIYLSPWDRNHPAYGTPEYNSVFCHMLEEILSNYGPVFEVWFDGACGEGPNGKRQVYDWPGYVAVVRRLQPGAVIFSDAGPDVRWVGNERGEAGETNWALLNLEGLYPGTSRYPELTEGHADGTGWVPAECDVSIRPGWFWRAMEDGQVKTAAMLEELYYNSAGRGGNLLLNIPPDRQGLIPAREAAILLEWRRILDRTFRTDLARRARLTADSSTPGHGPELLVDGLPATFWASAPGHRTASLNLIRQDRRPFDRILLAEPIALGQRIRSWRLEAEQAGKWVSLAEGTTIGAQRILRIPASTASSLRLTILDARATPLLSTLALFASPACQRNQTGR